MHIVNIASELAPLAKVGGLADVLLGLSRELSWKGHDIDIILPKYDCMDSNVIRDLNIEVEDIKTFYQGKLYSNTIWMGWVENLRVYFIEPHHPSYFFNRGCFYGCEDDVDRYLYFCRAAVEFLIDRKINPDILHIHDWQTATIAVLLKEPFVKEAHFNPQVFFTIHNLEYQGKCLPKNLDAIGLDGDALLTDAAMQDPYLIDHINLVKGGIVFSDYVTTVSPNYASEIKTIEGGRGLEKVFIQYQDKFSGILNGLDYAYWNPELDRYLPAHFSARESPMDKKDRSTLDKKAYIKKVLREKLYLTESYKPIIGCITRLVPQKGIDLIRHALLTVPEKGGQIVLLGSSPIPAINAEFHELQHKFQDHPDVHIVLQHQEELAHLIFAGSDMFIVPSLFEPCGLTQLIAMKYGTIPIVRKTGGLADTVFDIDYSNKPLAERNGYVFDYPDTIGIDSAIDRALKCWFEDPQKWRTLMVNAMQMDFSWSAPSEIYLDLYKKLTSRKRHDNS